VSGITKEEDAAVPKFSESGGKAFTLLVDEFMFDRTCGIRTTIGDLSSGFLDLGSL
jgi:hypothetical protein